MHEWRVVAAGAPEEVLTVQLVRGGYKLPVEIHLDPVMGAPIPVPLDRRHGQTPPLLRLMRKLLLLVRRAVLAG